MKTLQTGSLVRIESIRDRANLYYGVIEGQTKNGQYIVNPGNNNLIVLYDFELNLLSNFEALRIVRRANACTDSLDEN